MIPEDPQLPREERQTSTTPSNGSLEKPRGARSEGRPMRRGRWRRSRSRSEEPLQPQIETLNISELKELSPKALEKKAAEMGVEEKPRTPEQLIRAMLVAHIEKLGFKLVEGILEMGRGGSGFLRLSSASYQHSTDDTYVSAHLIREFNLKTGDLVAGAARGPKDRERYNTLLCVDLVWNDLPSKIKTRKSYDELTPLFPDKRMVLEAGSESIAMRALDLLAPLGRGQRCLIVAPPRAGKTILLQQIAESIAINDPDVEVIMLLLDERPEEVHNAKRIVKGEVISSTFDETTEHHVRIADLVIERTHRMLECGKHVVLLLDSLTRYARACNALAPSKGKLMSGGIESGSLAKPRKFFSSARKVEEGGSLTIVATVLVETGSRMDDLIFEEFKGTGNMEVYLSRDLQERRIYPAIHIEKTGTRREDLLYHPDELARIQILRRQLSEAPALEAMENLIDQLKNTKSNAELLMRLKLDK